MYTEEQYFEIQKAILYLYNHISVVDSFNKPELAHSLHTGFRLMDHGYPVELVIAGFLHDIMEEGFGLSEFKNLFGNKVYELVLANTKDKNINDWFEQATELVGKIAFYGEEALIVKAADVLDNFILRFSINDVAGKERTIHLANEIFKHTNSTDGIFGELHSVYDYWTNKK